MSDNSTWYSADIDRYVAAAVVINGGKALVLRRKPDDFMGGIWELPSGKMDHAESIEQALSRELKEETGLTLSSPPRLIGTFDYVSKSGRATRQVNFVASVNESSVTLTEHDAAEWIDAALAEDWPVTQETREILRRAFEEGA
ncbi:NUDIX domain-containing protein [Streptomyces bacillaris]|uniref:NUDIX hydrolase n=1 Tax=Streptomyces bacillaris TaxID=68179 RepID=UPI003353E5CB